MVFTRLSPRKRRSQLQVIKDKQVIEDNWTRFEPGDDDAALPEGDIIVPLAYWQARREELLGREGKVAVCINGDDELSDIESELDGFELIAIEFPVFRDGRGYSMARALRQRHNFQGDIRAVGEVLRDQLYFMQRVGISSYQLKDGKDPQDALKGFTEFSVRYQGAVDNGEAIYSRR